MDTRLTAEEAGEQERSPWHYEPWLDTDLEAEAREQAEAYRREQERRDRVTAYEVWLERRSEEAAVREDQEPAHVEAEIGGRPVKVRRTGYGMHAVETSGGEFLGGGLTLAVAMANAKRACAMRDREVLWG